MPILENDKAIKDYYEEVKHLYPDVDFNNFRVICKAPFNFVKDLIRSRRLPIIMIKHLGKFIPSITRVRERLVAEEVYHRKGIIDDETYNSRKTFLTNFVNDYNDESTQELIDDTEEGETSN